MTNPLSSRARAEELARLLEQGAGDGPAAALALRLRAVAPSLEAATAPRAEFRAALRTRLLAVAEVQAMSQADAFAEPAAPATAVQAVAGWAQSRRGQRRIGAAAGAMAGVVAFTGVGVAAAHSLPGQPFYALKRGAEDVQLSFADGDQAKGAKHLELADTRLREVTALAEGRSELVAGSGPLAGVAAFGGPLQDRINATLQDFDEQTTAGRVLLERVFRKTGKQEPLRLLKTFATEQQGRLAELLPALPASSVPAAQRSLELVRQVETTSIEQLALGTCGGECFPSDRGPELVPEPAPSPGATATPTPDSTDESGCACGAQPGPEPTPTPTPTETATPDPEPTATPSPSSSPSPTASPSPSPSPSPSHLPVPLPVPLPTDLPTPVPLPAPLPGLLPQVIGIVEDAEGMLPLPARP